MGGGGSSGKISYPAYIETDHGAWLDDIDAIITLNQAGGADVNSPYFGEKAYNPDLLIGGLERRRERFEEVVADIDDEKSWEEYVERALAKADEVLFDSTVLKDARTAFDHRSEDSFVSGVNNLSSWASGTGAVDSSAFSIGIALLEMERQRKVDDFDSTLHFELYKLRSQFMIQGTQQLTQILTLKLDGEERAVKTHEQVMRTTVIAKKEQVDRDIEMDIQDALWDIKLYQYAGQMLSSVSGGGGIGAKEPSPFGSALSGAAAGFAAGGPMGAAIGGAAGLLGGLFG